MTGQVAFSAGEISPLLHGRADYQRAQTGLRQCRGFVPLRQGGIARAPGTLHRGAIADGATAVRLIAFTFARNDAVVLEFTPLRMRVWRYGALVAAPAGAAPYELATPYDAAALDRLKWAQAAGSDAIYLVDGQRAPQRLARRALNDWTIADAGFKRGPFALENIDTAVTVRASGVTGAITLTGAGSPFVAAQVGSLMRLRAVEDGSVPTWTGNVSCAVGARMRYDGRTYEVTAGDNTGVNPPTHARGSVKSGPGNFATWRFIHDATGIVRITAYTNANSAAATVVRRLADALTTDATYAWAEAAWSARNGWPSAIALHDQRMVLASTTTSPRTLWFSTVGDLLDFEEGIEADESFAYDGVQSTVLWMQTGSRGLSVGALGAEHSSRATATDQVIGPQNAAFRRDSAVGSADVQPIAPDGRAIFVSSDGARVFELRYQFDQDATVPVELSLPSEHLGAAGFAEIVWMASPLRIGWLRRGDGTLALLINDATEDVLGWAPLSIAGGRVLSLAVRPSVDGTRDVVTLAVERTIGGVTRRSVEEVAPFWGIGGAEQPLAEACHLYAARTVTGAAVTTVTGLDHLEGAAVHVWTDRGAFGPLTVTGGAVAIGETVTTATAGLHDATHVAETLDLKGMDAKRRTRAVGLRWHRTAAAEMAQVSRAFGRPDQVGPFVDITARVVPADLIAAWSGVLEVPLPGGWSQEISQRIRPVPGAPMTLLALEPFETTGG